MKHAVSLLILLFSMSLPSSAKSKTVTLKILQTSDVHGCFFPWDFINRTPKRGTLARVSSYVNTLRKEYGSNVILLDNGDILQGQPTCYFYNYVNTGSTNVAASVINYLGYDAEGVGNHDVETGHAVYDKWASEVKCPMLAANVVSTATGKPYFKPYTVLEREGVKVAVIGMLTPAIPNWLKEPLWSGLRFEEIVASMRKWVDYVQKNEHPDVVVALLHSGREGGITTPDYAENVSYRVAKEVPGIDLVLFGHDHSKFQECVKNVEGKDVVLLNPSAQALNVCEATVKVTKDGKKLKSKEVSGEVVDICGQPVDEAFVKRFQPEIDSVNAYVDRVIGEFQSSVYTRDCFFGNAAFTDFIHNLQLQITGADISFNAPLSFNEVINVGEVRVSDMFNLYKYENQLYLMRLTGEEIRKHLEMSYDLWVNTMTSPDDHILLLDTRTKDNMEKWGFKNMTFNFDSAAGIDYTVDVTKPDGQKVTILRMSNGQPFDEKKWYKVAMNSYRGNGGGELLTKGAGIPVDSLPGRILWESPRDQRHYLALEIEKAKVVNPQPNSNWKFIPEEWAEPALKKDRELLFGK